MTGHNSLQMCQKMSDDPQVGKEIYLPTPEINSQEILLEHDVGTAYKQREASKQR